MPLFETQNISKTYAMGERKLEVLRDINLAVNAGELLAITGKSGSGKSTLMHILGCLDVPTTGAYYFDDELVSQMPPDALAHIRNKKIGFIFQTFSLLDDLDALDNVALPKLYGDSSEYEAREAAQKVLDLVGLGNRLHHYPSQLSGGERQRVAIARGLVNNPTVIFADEPTGNLDSKTGQVIIDLFKKLNRQEGKTVIIVTHDEELSQATNRIIELVDGHIISDKQLAH